MPCYVCVCVYLYVGVRSDGPLVGVGLTAALVSASPRRGLHHAHAATWTDCAAGCTCDGFVATVNLGIFCHPACLLVVCVCVCVCVCFIM
jgi:hypothetical protein